MTFPPGNTTIDPKEAGKAHQGLRATLLRAPAPAGHLPASKLESEGTEGTQRHSLQQTPNTNRSRLPSFSPREQPLCPAGRWLRPLDELKMILCGCNGRNGAMKGSGGLGVLRWGARGCRLGGDLPGRQRAAAAPPAAPPAAPSPRRRSWPAGKEGTRRWECGSVPKTDTPRTTPSPQEAPWATQGPLSSRASGNPPHPIPQEPFPGPLSAP